MRAKKVIEILNEVIVRLQEQNAELHNRLMSRDYPEYVTYKERPAEEEEKPEDEFDKIGSIT